MGFHIMARALGRGRYILIGRMVLSGGYIAVIV
jgi:hypothetical protein